MTRLEKRIQAVEETAGNIGGDRRVYRILLNSPGVIPEGMSTEAYLRAQGHDLRENDVNIVRIIVDSPNRHVSAVEPHEVAADLRQPVTAPEPIAARVAAFPPARRVDIV